MEIFKGRDLSPPSVPTLKVEIPAITLTTEHKKISPTTIVFVLEIARILLKHISAINEMLKNTVERCTRGENTEIDTVREEL